METILIIFAFLHIWQTVMVIILLIAVKGLLKSDIHTSTDFIKVWNAIELLAKQLKSILKSDD